MSREKKRFWQIETSDGKHEIKVIRRLNLRDAIVDSIEIYVDCAQVATVQPSGGKMIPDLEYDFGCGDETLTLVLHGRDIDIVHRGFFVGSRNEYKPQEKLPLAVRIILLVLPLSALAGIPWFNSIVPFPPNFTVHIAAVIMIALWAFLAFVNITSPIKSKAQKAIIGVIYAVCSWLMTAVIMYFPSWLFLTLVTIIGY